MSNTAIQQRLVQLLQEELIHAQHLLTVLDKEYEALRQPDAESITAISQEKLACLQALEQRTRARTGFTAEQGRSTEELIESSPAGSPSHRCWQQLRTMAEQAQKQNEINGGIVALAQRHTRLALDILTGKDATSGTYGPTGTARTDASSHSLAKA